MIENNFYEPHMQKHNKPKIEDVIPFYLEGKLKEIMLNFATYARTNKMPIRWASVNRWKARYKNKNIFWMCLPDKSDTHYGHVCLCLENINKCEEAIFNEGLQHFIWGHVKVCRNVVYGSCNSHGTVPGRDVTVIGKDFKNICVQESLYPIYNPEKADVDCIKRLLEMEKQARISA